MQSDKDIRQLRKNLECKKNDICQLEEKLSMYQDELKKKKDMQIQVCNLKQWLEGIQHKSKKMYNGMLNNLNVQTEKLNKMQATECTLRKENKKLLDVDDRIRQQLNDLKKQEQKLPMEIEDLTIRRDCIQNDICNTKAEVEKHACQVESWSKTLQCKEKECCDLRFKLDEVKIAYNRLNDTCTQLTTAVECTVKEIKVVKSRLKLASQMLKYEEETLSNELNIRCQKHHVLETELNEAKHMIDNEKSEMQKLHTSTAELRESCEKNNHKINCTIRNMKEENCAKVESLCCLKNRIMEQSAENECMTSEVNSLKKQVVANECLIEKMRRSAAVFEEQKNSKCEQLEKDINSLLSDIQEKETKIADVDHKAKVLLEKLKNSTLEPSICQSFPLHDADISCLTTMDEIPDIRIVKKLSETAENAKFICNLKQMYCSEDTANKCVKTA